MACLMLIDCVIQCLMDIQFFCWLACLKDEWMDGWMDGCSANTGGRGAGEGAAPPPPCKPSIDDNFGKTQSYVVWLLGLLVAGLVGQFVGWYSVGGCMDGWMDGWMDRWKDGRTDGRTDGWMLCNKGGRRCGGGRSASPAMQTKDRGNHRRWVETTWKKGRQSFGAPHLNRMFFRATKLHCNLKPSFG